MFTGIITDIGRIARVEDHGDLRVVIETAYDTSTLALGASVACSGPCLTVVDRGPGWFAVDVSAETRARTAVGQWTPSRRLNLERALKVGDELGGHIVGGHVDAVAKVAKVAPEGASRRMLFDAPARLASFLAPKGSVSIDGASLTVNEVEDRGEVVRFGVNIIPHTAALTTLGDLGEGDEVNIEVDMLARYLGRMREVSHSAV